MRSHGFRRWGRRRARPDAGPRASACAWKRANAAPNASAPRCRWATSGCRGTPWPPASKVGQQGRAARATTVAIDEPLVALTVAVGCPAAVAALRALCRSVADVDTQRAGCRCRRCSGRCAGADAGAGAERRAPMPRLRPVASGARGRALAVSGPPPAPRPPRAAPRRAAPGAADGGRAPRARACAGRRRTAAAPPLLAAEMIQAAASAARPRRRLPRPRRRGAAHRHARTGDRHAARRLGGRPRGPAGCCASAAAADVQAQWMPWLLAWWPRWRCCAAGWRLKLRRLQHERSRPGGTRPPPPRHRPPRPKAWPRPTVAGAAAPRSPAVPRASSGGYTTTRPGHAGPGLHARPGDCR
jgi:hypothetical protein